MGSAQPSTSSTAQRSATSALILLSLASTHGKSSETMRAATMMTTKIKNGTRVSPSTTRRKLRFSEQHRRNKVTSSNSKRQVVCTKKMRKQ